MNTDKINPNNPALDQQRLKAMSDLLIDEIVKTLGVNQTGILRSLGDRLFEASTRRLAAMAMEADRLIAESSVNNGLRWVVELISNPMDVHGAENIPSEGPTLLMANHPGTIDSLAIIASSRRADIKAIAGFNAFIYAVQNLRNHLIFATRNTQRRMVVMRQSIRHLQDGGCLLIFPAGHLEPDPALIPGAADSVASWHRSTEIFLKRVPETKVVPVVASHILLPKFVNHFLARARREPADQQRTAEMLQITSQILTPGKDPLTPRLTYGPAVKYSELLGRVSEEAAFEQLKAIFMKLLKKDVAEFAEPYPPLSLETT